MYVWQHYETVNVGGYPEQHIWNVIFL